MEAAPALIRVEEHPNGLFEVVLNRADALNAVSTEMAGQLRTHLVALREDNKVRAVVITSASEKAFCVGADLKERNGSTDDELRHTRAVTRAAYTAVLELPVPTVVAVAGYALGGGCEIALACDLVVASERAVFALPEVGVGVIPAGGGTQLLPRRIGWGRAADIIFTGRRIDAQEAYRLGVADRLVEPANARAAALELGAGIAKHSPIAVRQAKHSMRRGLDVDLRAGLDIEDGAWRIAAFSADRAEGVRAFVEKREPNWPGM